ncbi:MAG: sulfatase [Planctomycetia bacterium]|nr:sulfatase [Planctomycetia bacterium]
MWRIHWIWGPMLVVTALLRSAAAESPRPNILWISAEDLSAGTLGCYGGRALTPRIDALAAAGVRFDAAFSVAPVCAPSRSAIITGVMPTTLGSLPMRCRAVSPPHVVGFPKLLRAAGYYCTNNSKTDYNFAKEFAAGWNESGGQAHWRNRPDPGQPFFAVFNRTVTHESGLFGDTPARVRESLPEARRADPAAVRVPPWYPDTPVIRAALASRLDLAAALDIEVGTILDQLASDGLADDTIVVFWGDHGEGIPHGKRSLTEHGLRVPLLVSVPERFATAARLPGGLAPQGVTAGLVTLMDLGPTMLDLAGLPVPDWMEGHSILGPHAARRDVVVGVRDRMDASPGFGRTVRDDRFRYVRHFLPWIPGDDQPDYAVRVPIMGELRAALAAGSLPANADWFARRSRPVEELFDVQADPDEIADRASHGADAADLVRLREALRDWMRRTRDTGVLPEPILRREARAAGSEWAIFHPAGDDAAAARRYDAILAAAWDAAEGMPLEHYAKRATHAEAAIRFWAVSGAAWSALRPGGHHDRAAAVAVIAPRIADADPVVQINTARWLCRIQPEADDGPALDVLHAGIGSSDPDVRLLALVSLDEIGVRGRRLWEAAAGLSLGRDEEYSRRMVETIRARSQVPE